MSDASNVMSEFPAAREPRAAVPLTRPMYWSIRRELWENRSIYLAPLIVSAVVMFGSSISVLGLPGRLRAAASDPAALHSVMVQPFAMAPAPIMLASFIVGFFYCLDALFSERRDRSILFWKSLPVSDRTTVFAKASIPLIVLPLIAFVLSVITQFILLQLGTVVLLGSHISPATLWREFNFFPGLLIMLYGLTVHTLWFAPIYGWLLLVSAWARRAPVLWVLLPVLAIAAVERMAFNTSHFMGMLKYRVAGAMTEAFSFAGKGEGHNLNRLSQLEPARFLSTPGLWVGVAFAAACLVAAVRLRRNREPI